MEDAYGPTANMSFELTKPFLDRIRADVAEGRDSHAQSLLSELHPADIAAIIASFSTISPVGTTEWQTDAADPLVVVPLVQGTQWSVRFPDRGEWQLSIVDAIGRTIGTHNSNGAPLLVDLGSQASGMYVPRASEPGGMVCFAKIIRP